MIKLVWITVPLMPITPHEKLPKLPIIHGHLILTALAAPIDKLPRRKYFGFNGVRVHGTPSLILTWSGAQRHLLGRWRSLAIEGLI